MKNTSRKNLHLTYSGGSKCASDSSKTYDLQLNLICNKEAKQASTPVIDETDPCKPVISFETQHGCAVFSTTAWISFLAQHPYILGTLLLLFGAVVTFLGRKFFNYTIAFIGFGVGFLTTMLLFSIMGMLDGLNDK